MGISKSALRPLNIRRRYRYLLDIKKYESIAMLSLSGDERKRMGEHAEALAESFEIIGKIDTDGVKPLISVLNLHTVLREDETEKLLTRDEIMSNAPEQYDGYFLVPGTLE